MCHRRQIFAGAGECPAQRSNLWPYAEAENRHLGRGHEILTWLKYNAVHPVPLEGLVPDPWGPEQAQQTNGPDGRWLLPEPLPIRSFAILDDIIVPASTCFGHLLESRFVRTTLTTGLSEANVQDLAAVLREEVDWPAFLQGLVQCPNARCVHKQGLLKENRSKKKKKSRSLFKRH